MKTMRTEFQTMKTYKTFDEAARAACGIPGSRPVLAIPLTKGTLQMPVWLVQEPAPPVPSQGELF